MVKCNKCLAEGDNISHGSNGVERWPPFFWIALKMMNLKPALFCSPRVIRIFYFEGYPMLGSIKVYVNGGVRLFSFRLITVF
ncbi:hypothetical protein PSEUDO8Z_60343 [Pseudomonas sp. 8Z]|nr:hypothetical protein PSEUDO8Z_60343 [Pseudomonas sp. 8Z]